MFLSQHCTDAITHALSAVQCLSDQQSSVRTAILGSSPSASGASCVQLFFFNGTQEEARAAQIAQVAEAVTSYALTPEQNRFLLDLFNDRVKAYSAVCTVGELLDLMEGKLTASGVIQLRELCLRDVPVFGVHELQRVLAFADFRKELVVCDESSLQVEIRHEGWKAYCLVEPMSTVLRSVGGVGESLLWTHDEKWANARFRDPASSEFGLCGQFVGRSKFVSPCSNVPACKADALDALGLRGYDVFENAERLFIIHAEVSEAMLELVRIDLAMFVTSKVVLMCVLQAKPMVPLLYNVGSAVSEDAEVPEEWSPCANFQKGAMPGFTSGLRAELVINSFKLKAESVDELESMGIACIELRD